MVNARFRGVELEESEKSDEAKRQNPTSEAEQELLHSMREAYLAENVNIENWQRLAGFGIGVTSLLIEDFLTHPFVVVRRQCMVNSSAVFYHLAPFSVCRIMVQIRRKRGLSTFWKGQGSKLAVRGINVMAEFLISEATSEQLPQEVTHGESATLSKLFGHVLGKSMSIVLTLPFYTASIAETVETEQIQMNRSPFTFVKEGIIRVISWENSSKGHGRLLPLWSLVSPTLLHGILQYIITSCLQQVILMQQRKNTSSENSPEQSMIGSYFPELMASLTSTVLTEVLLYPIETVIYRLHLQGTRTMIDDTDNGYAVVSLCTNYEGFFDCFSCIHEEEGITGFYKGFGALMLQYIVQLLVLRFTRKVYRTISQDFGDVQ